MGKMLGKGDLIIEVSDEALEAGCVVAREYGTCGVCGTVTNGVRFTSPSGDSIFQCWPCLEGVADAQMTVRMFQ